MSEAIPRKFPFAAASTVAFSSLVTFVVVGAAFARTAVLARPLLGRAQRADRSVTWTTLIGGTAGGLLLIVMDVVGVRSLPEWTEIPPAIVAVQTGFSLLMQWVLEDEETRRMATIGGLRPNEIAFALYGVIVLPPTLLFIAVMTVVTILK